MKVSSDIEGWYTTPKGYKNSHFPGESAVKFALENSTHSYIRLGTIYEYDGTDFMCISLGNNNRYRLIEKNISGYKVYSISNLTFVILPGFMRVFSSDEKITNIKISKNIMIVQIGDMIYTTVVDTNEVTHLV